MRTIPRIQVDDEKVLDDVTAAKRQPRRARLIAAKQAILDAYLLYWLVAPDLENLMKASLAAPQKEAMIHAYTVETSPMTALRGKILDRIVAARCPFCGISESSTIDHYLPKETYPEFSIFSPNLVPCCSPCNTRKLDRILDENTNVRLFVHPFYDHVPETSFLKVDIDLRQDALILDFRITRPAGMPLATFQHLRSHFGLLDLADRYRRMGLEHLGGQYRSLKRTYGDAEDRRRVGNELEVAAQDFEERYGRNYWLAVLYRTLAVHDEFCDGGFEALKELG